MQSPPPGFEMKCPSRKRKLTVDQHDAASGYGFTDESNPLHEMNLVSSSVALSGSCAGSEQSENGKPSQDDVQSSSRTLVFGDNFSQDDQIAEVGNIVHVRKHEEADIKQSGGHSLVKTISPTSADGSANLASKDGQRNERSNLFGESLDKKSESLVGKLATRVAELWNGSLQLNSSIVVSAVAFFKSGEKMPDVKWSEILEVKGKVRLDAFEKYIQDLPRSRNRGLMVISLCCKDGSCKSGLAGMKEVAKGYKKRDIVGLAQLSKGIDLYICPRTDTIITILAKHGFFKGMAAVQDKQDSMIGCVVWRRSQAPSNSMVKKSEKKDYSPSEKPLRSSSVSFTGKVDKKDLSHARLAQKSTQVGLVTDGKTLDVEESKVFGSRQVPHESSTASTDSSIFLTSVFSHIPANHSASIYNAVSLRGKALLHVETPSSLHKKPKQTSPVHCPGLSFPAHVVKGHVAPPDDDLPEFDFGSACGNPQSPASGLSESAIAKIEKKLIALAQASTQGSTPQYSTVGTLHPKPASNQSGVGDFIYPRLRPNVLEESPFHKKNGNNTEDDRTTTVQNRDGTHAPQRRMPVVTTVVPPRRNLFDDEDDMPEWCPPSIELQKRFVPETRGSTASISSKVLNSSHENLSSYPPSHLLPFLSKAAYSPPPPLTRTSHFPMTYRDVKPGEPRSSDEHVLRGPNSLTRINTDPLLRPPHNTFDTKVTVHPTGWRGWRP